MRKTRIIRIFVSSTFSDMELERGIIQSVVAPYLKDYCKGKGWQLELVDLRWGISSQASGNHRTMRLCLQELANCQTISPKPNLLLLIGQRYGWVPLPETVDVSDVGHILSLASDYEKGVFDAWYERNDNTVPASFEIRPGQVNRLTGTSYEEDEAVLKNLFLKVSQYYGDTSFHDKYCISATESEIRHGFLYNPELYDQTIFYSREFSSCPDGRCDVYIESDRLQRIGYLKTEIGNRVSDENILDIRLDFSRYETDGYRTFLAGKLKEMLKRLVDKEIAESGLDDEREESLARQSVIDGVGVLVGRHDEIRRLTDYIYNSTSHEIFLIEAEPGYGSTAMLAGLVKDIAGLDPFYCFIGVSWLSSQGIQILYSMLRHFHIGYKTTDSYFTVSDLLSQYLLETKDLTVIVLDGIDHLERSDIFRFLSWIPPILNSNVKIIITCCGETKEYLSARYDAEHLALSPVGVESFQEILSARLDRKSRRVTDGQMAAFSDAFMRSGCDTQNIVVFEQIAMTLDSLSSFDFHPDNLVESISWYLDWLCLPENHGKEFVSTVLGLICYSRFGVTEDEILRIAYEDPKYRSVLLRDTHYSIDSDGANAAVPYMIWSMLYFHLEAFLTQRKTHGGIVWSFANNAIAQYIRQYLEKRFDNRKYILTLLENYFREMNSGGRYIRSQEELPYVMAMSGKFGDLADLLCDNDFIQEKCSVGMSDDVQADLERAISLVKDKSILMKLASRLDFIKSEKALLQRYCKYDSKFVRRQWEKYLSFNSELVKKAFTFMADISSGAVTMNDSKALICSSRRGDSDGMFQSAVLWDIFSGKLEDVIYIPLTINLKKGRYTSSTVENCYISPKGENAFLYDGWGTLWWWKTQRHSLQQFRTGYLGAASFVGETFYYTIGEILYRFDNGIVSKVAVLESSGNYGRMIYDAGKNCLNIVDRDYCRYVKYDLQSNGMTIESPSLGGRYRIMYASETRLLLMNEENYKSIYVAGPELSCPVELLHEEGASQDCHSLSVSQDGKYVIFIQWRDGICEVVLMDLSTLTVLWRFKDIPAGQSCTLGWSGDSFFISTEHKFMLWTNLESKQEKVMALFPMEKK